MPSSARLFPPSPKPVGGMVAPPVRAPRIKGDRAAKDPRFQRVIGQLQGSAKKVGQRAPAARKAGEAQAAAKPPANEKLAGARAGQVDEIREAKVEKPKPGGFLAVLRAAIDNVMPKNLDEADKFMEGGESEQIKGTVGSNVSTQKAQATGPTEAAAKAPPDTAKVEGKEVAALRDEAKPIAPPIAAGDAMPAPKAQADVMKPAQVASASADQQLQAAELTPAQLTKANDSRFSGVLTARNKAQETAAQGPAKYRASEQQALSVAKAGATGNAHAGLAALVATKSATGAKTKTRQQLAREKDEAERKKVTDAITAIFDKTKAKVESKLSTLEKDVMAVFDAGSEAALANMKNSANREIEKFKEKRYSGLIGRGRWIQDLFRDTPPEIKNIIAQARVRFTAEMDALAVRVAGLVDTRLAEAKAIVAVGQGEVKRYVAGLAPNLRSVGQQAERDMNARFDELRSSIDEKANDLAQKLADKYKEASEKADAAAKAIEDANKGALKALADKVGEIVKILAEFADRVVSLFKRAAGVVKQIVADPIGFLGNLLSAIKKGIAQFVGNIWTHIKQGFMTWLFGELTKAGVEIPSDLSLPSILKLVLGVLGLTWANIRPKIVRKVGERAVTVLEKVVEFLWKLFTNPAGLWDEMRAFVGNLKQMVIDAILDWVVTKVITSAITKIASMFNPAGAIIQAIIMVYNVGSWLAANISRILDFVESIVSSVERIVKGDVGGAATWIEKSLARAVPILIGFLAGLLGLGGISAKIKSFIEKVQTKVSKAVDLVIDKVFNVVKRLVGRASGRADARSDARTAAQKQADLDAGLSAAQGLLARTDESSESVQLKLRPIKDRFRLTRLELVKDSQNESEAEFHVHGEVNPARNSPRVKKPIDDEKNPVAIAEQAKPAPPPPGVDAKAFLSSGRGNKRLFATLKGAKRFVYIVRQQRWNPIKDDAAIQQAEQALRAELARNIPGYKELVDQSKPANAPGFDAAGVVPGQTPAQAQLVIGEVKGSAPTGSRQYAPREKFSALTSSLGTNLRELLSSPESVNVEGALTRGNVTVKIKLVGGMQVGRVASGRKHSTKRKIEADIRRQFKAFLDAQYSGLPLEQVVKAIRIEWDPP